jgi:hypothetical protein
MGTTFNGIERYPLYWPEGWPRTDDYKRRGSRYRNSSFAAARDFVLGELKRMSAQDVVISANIPLRQDGLPLASYSEPKDPGVAVYWVKHGPWKPGGYEKQPRVIACDQWSKTWENMRAIGMALEAMRAIERCGASQITERIYKGFDALPAKGETSRPWQEVLCIRDVAALTPDKLNAVFRELARTRHPDGGGSDDAFRELTDALASARAELAF